MNANTNPKYEKLKNLLKELFQLDQPDLDFGIYRIMHARSEEITKFLDNDLLPQVQEAFACYQSADKKEIQKQLDEAITQAKNLGVDPDASPKVKELRAQLASAVVDIDALESEVYDHLYSFFRRYYSEGDFISKRVYKEGVYAIPYEGEEVKLYWANYDQYYIKTSEYLRDYAFRLNPGNDKNPLRVHFRLVDAAEGEHNNVKEAEGKARVFVLTANNFISLENGELVINFEFRPATLTDWPEAERAGKQKPPTQKELIAIAEKRILAVQDKNLLPWITELKKPQIKADGTAADYSRLVAHLNRYTARNTFDYFIHKDLGGFLNRELDFYIKNEVMHLDDIENESAPRVEQYLSKIKVIRSIAKKIIDFLAQLENFQKKLWLKKKFVVETNYCLTLDRVPEEFYPEIAANQAQREEWVKLGFLEADSRGDAEGAEKNKDLFGASMDGKLYASDVSVEFLKAHNKLVLDTRFFSEEFKAKLIASIDHFDEQMDGLLIHSENFQALNLLQARYKEQVKCVYIDPPYNTGADEFLYRDSYQHSSWLAMMEHRFLQLYKILAIDGAIFVSNDENEYSRLRLLLDYLFKLQFIENLIWRKKSGGGQTDEYFVTEHDYITCYAKRKGSFVLHEKTLTKSTEGYPLFDKKKHKHYKLVKLAKWGTAAHKEDRPTMYFPLVDPEGQEYYPIAPDGKAGRWRYGKVAITEMVKNDDIEWVKKDGIWIPYEKVYEPGEGELGILKERSILYDLVENTAGSNELKALFGVKDIFLNPKPSDLIYHISLLSTDTGNIILDYFAGSGTTAHAVINLNREDGGKRKYILVEMGDYFDTVLKPRIQKVIYSAEWKDGKPVPSKNSASSASPRETSSSYNGISHCFKYIRLESYEDTLNNLELRRTQAQAELFASAGEEAKSFKEDYILHYMLDVESRGSASLLNTEAFMDPTAYKLKVKIPGSDESRIVPVDLIETFNYLLGLQVEHIASPQRISATFERDSENRLRIKERLKEISSAPSASPRETASFWWFRTVTGTTLDGRKILVIWRNRPGGESPEGVEQDNLVLDEWFKKMGYSSKDREFDLIYVNGTNNLENLKTPDDQWKVRLIEEDFKRLMFEETGV
ncbi:MAG: site-specific DNA-methyltransferase [Brevinematales bacterium]|nr:site-specific DNA-methyltransferase [Brevinematales bacterium]